ncbi:Ser-Thr-rich glycosyl-phosphatidyl-inositol-anchored membrane family-domain-containing protein [Usnea florida]
MRISSLSVVACLLTAIAAQSGSTSNPPTTPPGFTVTAGKSSTFTWKPTTSGTVTLTLRNGPSDNLNKGTVLASGITNSGSYSFTVPAGTASGTYTIEISSDSDTNDTNYSDSITVEGSDSVQSTNPASSLLATTTTSSTVSSPTSSSSDTSTSSSGTSTSSSGTSTIAPGSTTSTTKSSSSSSTAGATKSTSSSASSASGTSAPTSSTSTPTGSSKSASAGTALDVNYGLVAMALGIVAVF